MGVSIPIDSNNPPTMADVATFRNVLVVNTNGTMVFEFDIPGAPARYRLPIVATPQAPLFPSQFQAFFNSDPDLSAHGQVNFANPANPFIPAALIGAGGQPAPAAGPAVPPPLQAPALPGVGAQPQLQAPTLPAAGPAAPPPANNQQVARLTPDMAYDTTDVVTYHVNSIGLYLGIKTGPNPNDVKIVKKEFPNIAAQHAYIATYLGHAQDNPDYEFRRTAIWIDEQQPETNPNAGARLDLEKAKDDILSIFEKGADPRNNLNVDMSTTAAAQRVSRTGIFFGQVIGNIIANNTNPAVNELFASDFDTTVRLADETLRGTPQSRMLYMLAMSKLAAMIDGIHDSPVRILGKESLHGVLAEHVLPVIIGHFAGWQVHRNRLTNRHQLQGPKARVTHDGLLF